MNKLIHFFLCSSTMDDLNSDFESTNDEDLTSEVGKLLFYLVAMN